MRYASGREFEAAQRGGSGGSTSSGDGPDWNEVERTCVTCGAEYLPRERNDDECATCAAAADAEDLARWDEGARPFTPQEALWVPCVCCHRPDHLVNVGDGYDTCADCLRGI